MNQRLISLRAYARSRDERGLPGGTLRAVQKAIEAGRITPIAGKIDPDVADIQWERNTDPAQQKRGAPGALDQLEAAASAPPAAEVQTSAPRGDDGSASGDQRSRIREAARSEAARAELLEYELGLKRGTLILTEDVKRAAFEKARIARDALLAIPDRLAPLLAAEQDPAQVHAILAQELRRVCSELSAGEDKPTRQ
jgi:hypothetical protein